MSLDTALAWAALVVALAVLGILIFSGTNVCHPGLIERWLPWQGMTIDWGCQ